MIDGQKATVVRFTKPRRKALKITLILIVVILLSVGTWVGITAYKALKNITSLSTGGNNSILSLFNSGSKLKGQSDGRTNILLLGMGGAGHSGGTLSDTMQVLSINWKTNQVAMVSVPRDLWVNIPGHGYSKINEANSNGGGDLASTVVSSVLGIPIHYYVTMDFSGFKEIVDTLGGIDVNVQNSFTDYNYPKSECNDATGVGCEVMTVRFDAGLQHMDGARALIFARSRESTSDFDRSKRQQLILQGVKTKVMSAGVLANPSKITSLLNSLGGHLKTTLAISEIKSLWDEIQKIDTSSMITKVIDNSANGVLSSSTSSGGASIQIPKKGIGNYADLQALAQNIFGATDTATTAVAATNPRITVLNGSGKAGSATTAANKIKTLGYTVASVDTTTKQSSSVVYNCSGANFDTIATKIAALFSAQVSGKTSCGALDIQVIIGQN